MTESATEQPRIRWGILATGKIARTFTEDLVRLDDHRVVAVGSRNMASARDFAAEFGIERAHGSYEALAADEGVDVVYVATPHSGHFAAARLCLLAGRAVLVEKPFTATVGEAEELIRLADQRRSFAMEAMWTRFNPLIRQICDLIVAGAIGRVTAIQADFSIAPGYDPAHRLWNPELAGGALLDLGIYPIAFGSMLLGTPDRIRAVTTLAPTGVDADTAVIARYEGGALGLYHCGLWADSPTTATITGTGGHICVAAPFYRPEAFTVHSRDAEPSTHSIVLDGHGYTYQAQEVARCLRAGLTQSPAMPLAETLSIARTLDSVLADLADPSGGFRPAAHRAAHLARGLAQSDEHD
jgi:predicted dehydrogenase